MTPLNTHIYFVSIKFLVIYCIDCLNENAAFLRTMILIEKFQVVTAIKEYLQAVNTYKNLNHLSPVDQENIIKLQLQIASMENFKSLFLLLIRQYNTSLQSKQYLQDLITTNHMFLLFLDDVSKLKQFDGKDKMKEHLKQ